MGECSDRPGSVGSRLQLVVLLLSVPAGVPQPCTLRLLLRSHLDVGAVPRRSFFELLLGFSGAGLERDKLREFCSAAGQEELHAYCSRPRRTALEVNSPRVRTPDLKVRFWSSQLVPSCSRFWRTSLRPPLGSRWTTCWTCSLRSSPAPSPSPPP